MKRQNTIRTFVRFALILISIVLAQGILSLKFKGFAHFDLPLIYSIYYGFTLQNRMGSIAIGSTLGLMQDSLSGVILGLNGFSKTLIAFVSASIGSKVDIDQPVTRALALATFTFCDWGIKSLLGEILRPGGESIGPGLTAWTLFAVFNTLIGMAVFGYRSRFADATS